MASEARRGLLLIGLMKLLKALGLLVIGASLLSLLHRDAAETVRGWISFLRVDTHAHLLDRLLAKFAGISQQTLRRMGVGTLIYAALFGTEGIGLLLEMAWAEYMTTGVTLSFLPLEGYELIRHPSLSKVFVLLLNGAVVMYLLFEIRRRRQRVDKKSRVVAPKRQENLEASAPGRGRH